MSIDVVSPLRQRMIEDMTARKLGAGTQRLHISKLPIERSHVDDDALRIEPAGEAVEANLAGRLLVGHAIIEMNPRLRADVLEIASQLAHRGFVGDRAMTGDDDLDLKPKNIVADLDPVLHRAGPDDRMAADEQQIAGMSTRSAGTCTSTLPLV
jgi:hypothetical protein